MFVDFVHQPFEVGLPFATANNFAVAFRGQYIDAFGPTGVVFVPFHVKSLDFVGPVEHHDGGFKKSGEDRFIGTTKVVACLKVGGTFDPLGQVALLFFGLVQALAGRLQLGLMMTDLTLLEPGLGQLGFAVAYLGPGFFDAAAHLGQVIP